MFDRLKTISRSLKRELRVYQLVLRDTRTPWLGRMLLGAAVGYALSLLDLIPDFIPIVGHLDDVIIIPILVATSLRLIPAQVMRECRAQVAGEDAKQ